jgi:hypothetical protein
LAEWVIVKFVILNCSVLKNANLRAKLFCLISGFAFFVGVPFFVTKYGILGV